MPSHIPIRKPPTGEHSRAPQSSQLAEDLLEGADAIAKFLFGNNAHPRRARTAIQRGLPHFRIGNRVFGRKSVISSWIEGEENKSIRR